MSVEIHNLSKAFKKNQVLNHVDLTIEKGEIVALMGPSGAGKTTLLRCLCNLETNDTGEIKINDDYLVKEENGKVIRASKSDAKNLILQLGLVFQNYNLFPHLTVLENIIEAPLYLKKMSKEEACEKAKILLEKMNLGDKLHAYPLSLSGGQKQRVAIARACILNPSILCFDEPTSALDNASVADIIKIIKGLSESMAILIVTHDDQFADQVATRRVQIQEINQIHS